MILQGKKRKQTPSPRETRVKSMPYLESCKLLKEQLLHVEGGER